MVQTLANAWQVTADGVIDALEIIEDGEFIEREIGIANAKPFRFKTGAISRPRKQSGSGMHKP